MVSSCSDCSLMMRGVVRGTCRRNCRAPRAAAPPPSRRSRRGPRRARGTAYSPPTSSMVAIDRRVAERVAMPAHRFLGDLGEADALDAGRGAGEIFGDEIGLQPDRVENLRAAIGLIGGDAHLGHHLEQSLVDRLDVALDDFLVVELLRQLVLHRDQRLEGEIGVDRLGAVAGEAGEVMHLARLAGFDHEADRGAQALADQVMMHGGAGEQRRDRDAVGAGAAVRQDDDVDAVAHRGFGLAAQRVDARSPCRRRRLRPARWCRASAT